ncbi:MAG TPA: hypothetical protein VHN15_12490, partial [Thermoanaerobaculia bacterium]|nr:hypothetical protein [Thermoanaerobaculia bacterium]
PRDALIRQIDSPVRWTESVLSMAEQMGVSLFLEVGPGTVLAGLNRRIAPATVSTGLGDPDQLRQVLESKERPARKEEA